MKLLTITMLAVLSIPVLVQGQETETKEKSLTTAQAQELATIEAADRDFMTSMQAAVSTYNNASAARKQDIFAKACGEAGWPLPKDQSDITGCRFDLTRRVVVKVIPKETKK